MSADGLRAVEVEAPATDWPAIFAGATVAAGISFTLLAFGTAIGLSVISTAPTWRDSSGWLWLLSGIFLVFVALCAFGFGGYTAGRMRARLRPLRNDEIGFRDGMHGVITWGLAIIFSAVLAIAIAAASSRAVAPSAGAAGAAASVAGEAMIASELDELFRTDRKLTDVDFSYHRAEAARILLKSSGHAGVTQDDHDYLVSLTASIAGMSLTDATARVDRIIAEARDEIHRARVAAVMQAFLVAAALLVGLAVSWFAATEGGREREASHVPVWNWSWRRQYPDSL